MLINIYVSSGHQGDIKFGAISVWVAIKTLRTNKSIYLLIV